MRRGKTVPVSHHQEGDVMCGVYGSGAPTWDEERRKRCGTERDGRRRRGITCPREPRHDPRTREREARRRAAAGHRINTKEGHRGQCGITKVTKSILKAHHVAWERSILVQPPTLHLPGHEREQDSHQVAPRPARSGAELEGGGGGSGTS